MDDSCADASTPAVQARNMAVWRGDRCVLNDVAFSARYGEVLAVLGPNGAGKSTLLRAVCGILPHRGEVQVNGHVLGSLDPRTRAKHMAYVPQHTGLRTALPVSTVVAQGRFAHRSSFSWLDAADRAAITQAMELTDVARFEARAFTALSFGEQRRVLLARGLATGARIFCLDEPTASLDVAHALQLHGLLGRLAAQGYAVILVLHPLQDALRYADRAILLSEGRCARLGPVHEVVSTELVRQVYGVELRHGEGLGFDLCEPTS